MTDRRHETEGYPEAPQDIKEPADPVSLPSPNQEAETSFRQWRYERDAWRWVHRFNHRHANMVLRARSAKIVPASVRNRFVAMGLPDDIVDETLESIHKLEDWPVAWVETAQRYLGEFRRQTSSQQDIEGAKAQWLAALCYHSAQIVSSAADKRTVLTCRAAAASLFAQAQPYVYPNTRKITIPWRTRTLPAYFQTPEPADRRSGLVVLLNGASTSKEETLSWASPFLQTGLAVLALDSPGTGEVSANEAYLPDQDDILNGVFDMLSEEPAIDMKQVFVTGISMGGNQAIRCAAYDRRIAGVVAVTPPYDPPRWLSRASPLLTQELSLMVGDAPENIPQIAAKFSLFDVVPLVRCPVLVFGAGRDVIVPSTEAQLLAYRLGAQASLVWYPKGGHCLYDHIRGWTSDAASWMSALSEVISGRDPRTAMDAVAISATVRAVLEQTPQLFDEDPFGEYEESDGARLLDPDEIAASLDDDSHGRKER